MYGLTGQIAVSSCGSIQFKTIVRIYFYFVSLSEEWKPGVGKEGILGSFLILSQAANAKYTTQLPFGSMGQGQWKLEATYSLISTSFLPFATVSDLHCIVPAYSTPPGQ